MKTAIDKCLVLLSEIYINGQPESIDENELKKLIRLDLGATKITIRNYLNIINDFSTYNGYEYKFNWSEIKKVLEKRIEATNDTKLIFAFNRFNNK